MNFARTSAMKKAVRALLALAVVLMAGTVWAGTITGVTADLTAPNSGLEASPSGSYGTVSLVLNADGTIGIDLTMAPGFGVAGGGNAFGFNVAGGDLSGLQISDLTTGFTAAYSNGNLDGRGNYTEVITGPPASGAVHELSFVVSRTDGFTSAMDLVAQASGGIQGYFAAHVVPTDGSSTGYAAATGYTTTTVTPEPATWLMLLTGLCGLAFVLRRKGRERVVSMSFPASA